MVSSSDLRRGVRFEVDNTPYIVEDVAFQTPSARGANTLVKVKARDMLTGQLRSFTFKAGEHLPDPEVEYRKAQFLYKDDDFCHFMDLETYEQYSVPIQSLAGAEKFLKEGVEIRLLFYQGNPVNVELPKTVDLEVIDCEPGFKGDTVSNVMKSATVETGLQVQVPLFIEQGDVIRIDTRDGRYIERVKRK